MVASRYHCLRARNAQSAPQRVAHWCPPPAVRPSGSPPDHMPTASLHHSRTPGTIPEFPSSLLAFCRTPQTPQPPESRTVICLLPVEKKTQGKGKDNKIMSTCQNIKKKKTCP